MAGYM